VLLLTQGLSTLDHMLNGRFSVSAQYTQESRAAARKPRDTEATFSV